MLIPNIKREVILYIENKDETPIPKRPNPKTFPVYCGELKDIGNKKNEVIPTSYEEVLNKIVEKEITQILGGQRELYK